ncbi:alpha/beta hydrolase fold domain-containing protein [Pararhodobacter sp.]|uniref:alpha/beta hydrolase fold domain-containing protein n=1 Tax=Pararhodobacter sp. TaxID=2127056 RepID=UPI002FDD906A
MSLRARLLRWLLWTIARPLFAGTLHVGEARGRFLRAARLLFRAPPYSLILRAAGPVPALWVQNRPSGKGVILYFHGGAYLMGAPETHAAMLAELTRLCGLPAFLPRYRLAPEHPFPAAFEDALTAWNRLRALGHAPGEIVLGGDSAGGGLALALLAHLCSTGQRPAGAFALSPWTDLTFASASLTVNAGRDPMLPVERIEEVRAMILGDAPAASRADPRLSPLFATFTDPPPVQIHVAETEILRDDSLRLQSRLPAADIRVAGDLPHAWPIFHNHLPEARDTLATTADFIRACLARSSAGS